MESFVIEGGRPLSGSVRAAGNKNGALPILAASVLATEAVRLLNVPRIQDVETMVELLVDIGADVEWTGPNEIGIDPANVSKTDLDPDLCRFLVSLGARIEGIGSNILHIHGVERLGGGEYRIGPDHIEVASFVGLAAAAGGDVTIEDVDADDLISIVPSFRKLGIEMEISDSAVRVPSNQQLHIEDDLGRQVPKIES